MGYAHTAGGTTWAFPDLKDVLAKATSLRSGDTLAGIAATSSGQRMAARMALSETPLKAFLSEATTRKGLS